MLVEWIAVCRGVEDSPGGWTVHGAGSVMGQPIAIPSTLVVPLAVALLGLNDDMAMHSILWQVNGPDGQPIDAHELTFGSSLPAADEVPPGLLIRRIVQVDCQFDVRQPGIHRLGCWATDQDPPWPAVQFYVEDAAAG